jgi:putative redox protein
MGSITLRWVESNLMVGTDSSGHSIVIGRSPEDKSFIGIKPSDLLLMAAASCTMYDVAEILVKQREPLEDLKITCSGEQLSDPPYTFTSMYLHYTVKGGVNPVNLERAIRLSEDKYCSVLSTLRLAIPVTSDFEIL